MLRDHMRKTTALLAAGLLITACGGSDDEPAAQEPAADDSDAPDGAAADDGATDGGSTGDEGSSDGGSDGAAADDGAMGDEGSSDGAGTNDEAQQSLDDAGVDLDLDQLEEDVGALSTGEGGGVVTIDGVDYTFEATAVCIVQGTDFVAEGLGQDPDGNPAWVSVSASNEDFDGDGEAGPSIDVFVEVGKTELFGSGSDDAPDFSASYYEGFGMPDQEIAYELNGDTITGSGPVQDYNGVAFPFGESRDMSFEATCS